MCRYFIVVSACFRLRRCSTKDRIRPAFDDRLRRRRDTADVFLPVDDRSRARRRLPVLLQPGVLRSRLLQEMRTQPTHARSSSSISDGEGECWLREGRRRHTVIIITTGSRIQPKRLDGDGSVRRRTFPSYGSRWFGSRRVGIGSRCVASKRVCSCLRESR